MSSSALVAGLFGAAVGLLVTGCPSPGCPQCSLKNANFTINPAEGAIVDVVMKSTADFTGHCAGEKDPAGCTRSDERSLGVLPERKAQKVPLPWESDDDDVLRVTIDVVREAPDGGTRIQTPAPAVTISR
jgi:hypothetical protein